LQLARKKETVLRTRPIWKPLAGMILAVMLAAAIVAHELRYDVAILSAAKSVFNSTHVTSGVTMQRR